MKKILTFFALLIFLFTNASFAQLPKNSWSFGFGISYPRYVDHALSYAEALNYGAFVDIQRNFSEHVGLRGLLRFSNLQGTYGTPKQTAITRAFTLNVDLLYYFVPCETVSPYLFFGAGPSFYLLDNPPNKSLGTSNFAYDLNGGLGIRWNLDDDWTMGTEINYHTIMDAKFDGTDGPTRGSLFGGDYKTYFSFDIGFNYYLDKSEPSKLCSLYDGISQQTVDPVDYGKIEEIVKKYIPKEVIKEVAVSGPAPVEKWVLVGVNFDFNSAKITAASYPILYDAAKTLLKNSNINVEIQGYTDNIGSEQYNQKLSQKRADIVREYLISKGISASRLKAVGYGEKSPVADNKTADGRAMNRRIEFKTQ